jgi:hypothetical protein
MGKTYPQKPECLALDVARDIIQTRHPAAHPRTS